MKVKKTVEERIGELESSLRLVSNCVGHFIATKDDSYLVGVLSQLRALASFKEGVAVGKKTSLNPLLLDLANQNGVILRLHSAPPKPQKGRAGLASALLASKTWSVEAKNGWHNYSLREWMATPAWHTDTSNSYCSRNTLVRELSEKGAVHYDEDVGELVDSLRRTSGSRYNGVQFFIIDTSAAIAYLGNRFIKTYRLRQSGVRETEMHDSIKALDDEFERLSISMI